jgi:hypothetical protein
MNVIQEVNQTVAAFQAWLSGLLAKQEDHAGWPRWEVLWDEPFTLREVPVRCGALKTKVSVEQLQQLLRQRKNRLALEKSNPLRGIYVPQEWRAVLLEMIRKRLEQPGVQLTLWVSGGIRSSKTEFLTWLASACFWYTPQAWVWGVHETDVTSRSIQQARVYRFVPPQHKTSTGRHKKELTAQFNYSEGNGFTGGQFVMYWNAEQEDGSELECGGRFEFRFYGQDPGTMVGQELTHATSDELIPPSILKLIDDRLLTAAAATRKPEFLQRLMEAQRILERGDRLPLALLALVGLAWQTVSFTPKLGWTPSTALFLQGAELYDYVDPRPWVTEAMEEVIGSMPTEAARKAKRAELEEHPWRLGTITRVPRFAQPADSRKLVAFLPTYTNKFKGNWAGAVQAMQGKTDEEINKTLFGVVTRNVQSLLGYDPAVHKMPESALPSVGTIYEVSDPAPKKPWVIKWYLVDTVGRKRVLQEWPCETWEVEDHGLPGPWATASESDKLNGDPGPAQQMDLKRGWDDYTRRVWQGRQRLAQRLRKVHGDALRIATEERVLEWSDRPNWKLEGEFVKVAASWMDGHFAQEPTINKAGANSTAIEQMNTAENAIIWDRAAAGRIDDGVMLLQAALSSEVMGIRRLTTQDECTNTIFAWLTYSFPQHGDNTTRKDEACKDFVDPDRYLEVENPEDESNVQLTS